MSEENSVIACPACGKKNRVNSTTTGRPRCGHCQVDLPWVVNAGDASFSTAIETQLLVLVDLWAPWCGPCRMVAPILERLAAMYVGRLKVVKVNVDESPALASKYQASSIPMLLFLRNGELIDTIVGAQPEHVLRQRIDALFSTKK